MKKKPVHRLSTDRTPTPPNAEAVSGICADLLCLLDLRTACQARGVSIATMRRGLASTSPAWRSIQAEVQAAQIEVQRKACGYIESAAAIGSPTALAIMAARMESSPDRLEEPPADPVAWMRWRLADVQRRIGSAEGIAYNQLLRQESELRAQLKAETAESGESRTPAQVMAGETSHAREVADVHLQVYVVEYLRRHQGLFLATKAGRIEIVA